MYNDSEGSFLAGVNFIKVGRNAQIIEIALSKLGARRKAS